MIKQTLQTNLKLEIFTLNCKIGKKKPSTQFHPYNCFPVNMFKFDQKNQKFPSLQLEASSSFQETQAFVLIAL